MRAFSSSVTELCSFLYFRTLSQIRIKFSFEGGKITITLKFFKQHVEVKIADSGIGIEKDNYKNIFNIEAATSTTGTQGEEGTGLGLALCHQIVPQNNGRD